MTWDKKNLEGQVQVQDIVESANETIPKMKAEGADVIIALAHTGIEKQSQSSGAENAVFDLAPKRKALTRLSRAISTGSFLPRSMQVLLNSMWKKERLTAFLSSCQAAGANT